ncbi:MAG: SDR family oxidoreductase [Polyangiaceae bacterium]
MEIDSQHDKVVAITGASSGIGRVTALELARAGARVLLLNRSRERTQPVLDAIAAEVGEGRAEMVPLDLGSLDSVREAARTLLARDEPLHVLINNAGLAGQRGETKDGFELAFGTNHLGHFLLTQLLLERLKQSAPARVVTVASRAHLRVKGIDFDAVRGRTRSVSGYPEYSVSKLANVLFSAELGRRMAGTGVRSYSLHPGVVASDIWRRIPGFARPLVKLFMISNEEGARTSLYCATAPELADQTSHYYDECKEQKPSRAARDEALARELWERSEGWTQG